MDSNETKPPLAGQAGSATECRIEGQDEAVARTGSASLPTRSKNQQTIMNKKLEKWIDRLTWALKQESWSTVLEVRKEMKDEVQPQWAVCRTFMPCGESELRFVRASTEQEALAVFDLVGTEEELNAKGIAYCARRVQP